MTPPGAPFCPQARPAIPRKISKLKLKSGFHRRARLVSLRTWAARARMCAFCSSASCRSRYLSMPMRDATYRSPRVALVDTPTASMSVVIRMAAGRSSAVFVETADMHRYSIRNADAMIAIFIMTQASRRLRRGAPLGGILMGPRERRSMTAISRRTGSIWAMSPAPSMLIMLGTLSFRFRSSLGWISTCLCAALCARLRRFPVVRLSFLRSIVSGRLVAFFRCCVRGADVWA